MDFEDMESPGTFPRIGLHKTLDRVQRLEASQGCIATGIASLILSNADGNWLLLATATR